jgi:structural maintenance of chromosome 2
VCVCVLVHGCVCVYVVVYARSHMSICMCILTLTHPSCPQRLNRFLVAHTFLRAEQTLESSVADEAALRGDEQSLQRQNENLASQVEEIQGEVADLAKAKSKAIKSEFHELEQLVEKRSKALTKAQSAWTHKKKEVKAEEETVAGLAVGMTEVEKSIADKQAEIASFEGKAGSETEAFAALEGEINALQGQLLGVGMGGQEDGQGGSLAEQLMAAQSAAAAGKSEAKGTYQKCIHACVYINMQYVVWTAKHVGVDDLIHTHMCMSMPTLHTAAEMKLAHSKKALVTKTKALNKHKKESTGLEKDLSTKKSTLAGVESKLGGMDHNPKARARLAKTVDALERQVSEQQTHFDSMNAKLGRFQFQYARIKNFDDRKVKGLVASLINVEDVKYVTALEVGTCVCVHVCVCML